MSEQKRTLVVMRHAQAEHDGTTDFDRRLTERGERDARAAGAWLGGRDVEAEAALVSAAVRTHQTWEALADGAGWDVEVASYDDALYDAGPESALDLIRDVDEGISSLVVVGHNPTMASLAQLLDDGEGDEDAGAEMVVGYPTAATAVFEVEGDWEDLDEAGARLLAFHVGRG